MVDYVEGVRLHRTDENVAEIDALVAMVGGRVGLATLLGDLNRRGRRSWAPGRAVHRAYTWDREDRRTTRWWPQGVSTSADASDTEEVEGRRLLVVTWYAKELADGHQGSRVTFVDIDSRRYRHVLLVVPRLLDNGRVQVEPLRVHAGGVVWSGPFLHVAATARGFHSFRLEDLLRIPDDRAGTDRLGLGIEGDRLSAHGYRYLLPVRFSYQAFADDGHERLRYSCLSLDRHSSPPQLVVGEYGRGTQTRRLAHFPLDPESRLPASGDDGISRPLLIDEGGVVQTQGVAVVDGEYHVTVSHGPWVPGSVYVGRPGAFRRYRWATPMGPEDLAWWPSTDELWSLSEHPRRRWLFSMRRRKFER